MASNITTNRTVDSPVELGARYRFDSADRRKIDDQIRGCQQHLVDLLLTGRTGTWYTLDASSVGVVEGDVVCAAGKLTGTVTKATSAGLAAGKGGAGVVLRAAAPGGAVMVATQGLVPKATTGLGSGIGSLLRINTTTARLERVSAFTAADCPAGTCDSAGNAMVSFANTSGQTLYSNNATVDQSFTQVDTSNATPTTIGSTFTIDADAHTQVEAEITCLKLTAPLKSKTYNIRRFFLNDAGTISSSTQVDLIDPVVMPEGDTLGGSVSITRTGAVGRIEVTGIAATDLRWRLDSQTKKVLSGGGGEEPPPPEEWDPASISGLAADIDIRDATNGGGLVTAIPGATITGGEEPGYTATNPDYNNLPTADIGNVSAQAIRLTSAQHGITTGARTIFLVCDATVAKFISGAAGIQFLHTGGGAGDDFQASSDGFVTILTAASDPTVPQLLCFVIDGANSRIYAGSKTAIAAGNTGALADLTGVDWVIGNNSTPSSGDGMGGSIARVLVYAGNVANADVGDALDGLAELYGLAVTP